MVKLCADTGVAPEDIVMLVLAYSLDAEKMGFFTKKQWMKGMESLQCSNTQELKSKLPELRSLLENPVSFRNIYTFAFNFMKEEDRKDVDIATALAMMELLLGERWSLFPSFQQYLSQSNLQSMSKDLWLNTLDFSENIRPDLSDFDEDRAWSLMLDKFVEWYREEKGIMAPKTTTQSFDDKWMNRGFGSMKLE